MSSKNAGLRMLLRAVKEDIGMGILRGIGSKSLRLRVFEEIEYRRETQTRFFSTKFANLRTPMRRADRENKACFDIDRSKGRRILFARVYRGFKMCWGCPSSVVLCLLGSRVRSPSSATQLGAWNGCTVIANRSLALLVAQIQLKSSRVFGGSDFGDCPVNRAVRPRREIYTSGVSHLTPGGKEPRLA